MVVNIIKDQPIREYIFTHTPCHGYLRVPKEDLYALGMIDGWEFNPCFDRGDDIEIEEDEDVPEFLRRAEQAGWKVTIINRNIAFKLVDGVMDEGEYSRTLGAAAK